VPGLQTGPCTSTTRAVWVPGHQEPPSEAGASAIVTGWPLVVAGTATVRGPTQLPLPPVRLSVKLTRDPPAGPEEAGAIKRSENWVVGPPRAGVTVSAPAVVPVLLALEVVEALVLVEALVPVPPEPEWDELEVAEPHPASPTAPVDTTTVSQRRIRAVSGWRLIAGPSLRRLTRDFAHTVDLSTRM
jgi:hypothetical protein